MDWTILVGDVLARLREQPSESVRYHRAFIGIELNPEYAAMARRRILNDQPLFNTGGHSETLPAAAPQEATQALLAEARPEETEADRGLASPKGSPQGQGDDRTTEEGL